MLGLLEFLARKGPEVRSAVVEARRRTLHSPPTQVHLALQPTPYRETEQFFVQPRPENGESRASSLVEGENRTRFVPTTSRSAPWGYAFDPGLQELARLLRRHGIEVERLHDATTVPVERYRLDRVIRSPERYQRHRMTELRVEVEAGIETLAPGSFLVRVGQRGARLIPQLLEPEAVDSAARWNFLDSHLPEPGVAGSHLPLYRLNANPGVPTSLLP